MTVSPAAYTALPTGQCHRSNTFDSYRYDSQCDWLIKPRIRIDSAFANNPQNFGTLVCRVDVRNQGDTLIKSFDIKVRNFKKHLDSLYRGNYLEEFYFTPYLQLGDTSTQNRTGDWGNGWAFTARVNGPDGDNHADIQVWWYGNCDMWIDYVRVDNDVADNLFKGYWEDPNHPERQWLYWEGHDIACHNDGAATYRFYIELFEFNNIPCMSYVSRKLDSIVSICGKHVSLWCIPIPFTYSGHVPWSERLTVQNVNHFKTNFIEKMGVTEFMMGIYPFNSLWIYPEVYPNYNTWTRIPNTLPTYDTLGVLAQAIDPEDYDGWLQNYFDRSPYSFESGYSGGIRNPVTEDPGGYRYNMQFADAVSKK